MSSRRQDFKTAFTLVELLVVISIIGLLFALLLPALHAARLQANLVSCMSRERQLTIALINYAQGNRSRFPPNTSAPSPGFFWMDYDRLAYHSDQVACTNENNGQIFGTIFTCPADHFFGRTYSMNIWASSKVDAIVTTNAAKYSLATFWNYGVHRPERMLLLSETWSSTTVSKLLPGFYSAALDIGYAPVSGYTGPAQRFGSNGGFPTPSNEGPWGYANCDLAFVLHRAPSNSGNLAAKGRVNIAFADGHVATLAQSDLVDASGNITGAAYWSPLDYAGQ